MGEIDDSQLTVTALQQIMTQARFFFSASSQIGKLTDLRCNLSHFQSVLLAFLWKTDWNMLPVYRKVVVLPVVYQNFRIWVTP